MRVGPKLPATATKQQIEDALVRHRIRLYPSLYAGHEDSARFFVRHHEGKTRAEMALTARCYALMEDE